MRRSQATWTATLWRILAPPLALARARLPFVLAGSATLAMVLVAYLIPVIVPAASATSPAYTFTTGAPDGRIGMLSRPSGPGQLETEAADDFILSTDTDITNATFTGLVPAATLPSAIQGVRIEVYRIFPQDSDTLRTPNVPTRVNSPADVEFAERDSSVNSLTFVVSDTGPFSVTNTVVNGINPKPNQLTGGEGPASGEEFGFDVTFSTP
jgi:hypothetical protein